MWNVNVELLGDVEDGMEGVGKVSVAEASSQAVAHHARQLVDPARPLREIERRVGEAGLEEVGGEAVAHELRQRVEPARLLGELDHRVEEAWLEEMSRQRVAHHLRQHVQPAEQVAEAEQRVPEVGIQQLLREAVSIDPPFPSFDLSTMSAYWSSLRPRLAADASIRCFSSAAFTSSTLAKRSTITSTRSLGAPPSPLPAARVLPEKATAAARNKSTRQGTSVRVMSKASETSVHAMSKASEKRVKTMARSMSTRQATSVYMIESKANAAARHSFTTKTMSV